MREDRGHDRDRRGLDRVVGRAGIERVQARPADDLSSLLCHQDRVARPSRSQPRAPLLGRALLGLERRKTVLDSLVVDAGDRGGVFGLRPADARPGRFSVYFFRV